MIDVRVQTEDFNSGEELLRLEEIRAGGIASFTGLVRTDDGVTALTLDHYPGMTEKALRALAEDAITRWALTGLILIHRIGRLEAGARIVFVGTASAHRAAALESCAFLIDRLKTDAPFWKREHLADETRWVEAKSSDDRRAAHWQ